MSLNFEHLTIWELKQLTEEYDKLQKENKILNIKYPNKLREDHPKISAQDLIDWANV